MSKNKGLSARIKEMEAKKREQVVDIIQVEPEKIDFDSWFHLRSAYIPAKHLKEIIWSDFKARKLTKKELLETYDKALKEYGISLEV